MFRPSFRIVAIIVVTLIALELRLRAVDLLPIDYDEDDYLRAGQQYAAAIQEGDWGALAQLNYRPEHPPLAKLVYGVVLAGLPQSDEIPERPTTAGPASSLPEPHLDVARKTAAVSGVLEVLALALVSPLAGLFLAVHTFTIKYTSQVMLEALPALTSAVAVLAYARSKRQWNGWLALSAVALGLTASSKYLYAIVGVVIVVHWLWETWGEAPRNLRPMTMWGVLALGVFFATDPYLWPAPVDRLRESVFYHGEYIQSDAVQRAGFPVWQPLVWLAQSVPWHPGVFMVSLDVLITVLALLGLKRLWQKNSLYVIWLAGALGFLLVWPTKWPQYILVLTVPLSLAAAEGFQATVQEPLTGWLRRLLSGPLPSPQPPPLSQKLGEGRGAKLRLAWRETRQAFPWLVPGIIVLGLIALFPMLFQTAMALTDFGATAIRDGLSGGVWREVWLGLTGQVKPVAVQPFSRPFTKEVHYAGPGLLLQLLSGAGADILVFDVIWTVLSVGLQTALGLAVALMLHRRGVRFKGWWRAIFILPWAIPEFVGGLIWAQVFDPRFGWFNLATASWAQRADYPGALNFATQWQQNPNYGLLVLLITATWYGFPFMMLAATAGLKLLPPEVYAAAAIDGANSWQRFRLITWPLLLPLLVPAIIMRSIFAFNQFYLFYVLYPPDPLATFAIVSFFLFDEAGQYAVSAAINLFTVIVLVALILWFNRWSRASEGVTYA
ncbi:MAG: ABC transporter permease subunit [Anaerolineae bacterium]